MSHTKLGYPPKGYGRINNAQSKLEERIRALRAKPQTARVVAQLAKAEARRQALMAEMRDLLHTGYRDCACRDCMEIAIGGPGALCLDCEAADCDPERECQAEGAYGTHDVDANGNW